MEFADSQLEREYRKMLDVSSRVSDLWFHASSAALAGLLAVSCDEVYRGNGFFWMRVEAYTTMALFSCLSLVILRHPAFYIQYRTQLVLAGTLWLSVVENLVIPQGMFLTTWMYGAAHNPVSVGKLFIVCSRWFEVWFGTLPYYWCFSSLELWTILVFNFFTLPGAYAMSHVINCMADHKPVMHRTRALLLATFDRLGWARLLPIRLFRDMSLVEAGTFMFAGSQLVFGVVLPCWLVCSIEHRRRQAYCVRVYGCSQPMSYRKGLYVVAAVAKLVAYPGIMQCMARFQLRVTIQLFESAHEKFAEFTQCLRQPPV